MLHAEKYTHEQIGHFRADEIPRGQRKHAHATGLDHVSFLRVTSDRVVLGQHDPAAPPGFVQPFRIGGVLREHVIVDDDFCTRAAQRFGNVPAAETSVDEKYWCCWRAFRRHAPARF